MNCNCISNIIFQLEKLEYDINMNRKVVDIDNYVPFQTTREITAFCSPDDGLLKEKKDALKERIYASGDTSSIANFVSGVVTALFDGPLLGTHKWPFKK